MPYTHRIPCLEALKQKVECPAERVRPKLQNETDKWQSWSEDARECEVSVTSMQLKMREPSADAQKKGRLRSHASVSCFALLSRLGAKVIETAAMGSSFHANGQKAPNASHRPNTSPVPLTLEVRPEPDSTPKYRRQRLS